MVSLLCTSLILFVRDSHFFCFYLGVIEVDNTDPFNNRELLIAYVPDERVHGTLRNVYRISLDDQDIRDVLGNNITFRLLADHPNCAELIVPLCSYTRRHPNEAQRLYQLEQMLECNNERAQNVLSVARNAIGDKKKKILVRFEEGTILSNECYSPAAIDGRVNYDMIPLETSFPFMPSKSYGITMTTINWNVTTVEGFQRIVSTPRVDTAQDKLNSVLAHMSLK